MPRRRAPASLLVLLPLVVATGPCGPVTGGRITGDEAAVPASWSFTDAISTIQVETRPDDPYSVTTWCFTDGPTLFLAARAAARKPWVQYVTDDPRVRLRIGEHVYRMTVTRLTDEAELRRIIPLLRAKYRMARWGMDDDPAASPDTWFFEATPRRLTGTQGR